MRLTMFGRRRTTPVRDTALVKTPVVIHGKSGVDLLDFGEEIHSVDVVMKMKELGYKPAACARGATDDVKDRIIVILVPGEDALGRASVTVCYPGYQRSQWWDTTWAAGVLFAATTKHSRRTLAR